jgi:hypothetical protein
LGIVDKKHSLRRPIASCQTITYLYNT